MEDAGAMKTMEHSSKEKSKDDVSSDDRETGVY